VIGFHYHLCERCNVTFSHDTWSIQKGSGHHAHLCPNCDRPVNLKINFDDWSVSREVDFENWYGPDGADVKVNLDPLELR
jgi:hypothetical protein